MSEMPVVNDINVLRTGTGPTAGRSPEQLKALAAQFESILVGQMLREMRQSMFDDENDKSSGMGSGPLADAMFSEFSSALSRAGGFGLGASLLKPLTEQAGVIEASGSSIEAASGVPIAFDSSATEPVAPMPGRVSSGYGWRKDPIDGQRKFHSGLDLALPVGHEVPSARDGEVEFAGEQTGFGLTVVVKHDDRTSTRYAHLSEILVGVGELVTAGKTIAKSGATGRTTGPHLHFEVLEAGKPVDPGK